MSSTEVKGPFGLWPFPLINLLRQLLAGRVPIAAARPGIISSNTERIRWTDWTGKERVTVIEREIR